MTNVIYDYRESNEYEGDFPHWIMVQERHYKSVWPDPMSEEEYATIRANRTSLNQLVVKHFGLYGKRWVSLTNFTNNSGMYAVYCFRDKADAAQLRLLV